MQKNKERRSVIWALLFLSIVCFCIGCGKKDKPEDAKADATEAGTLLDKITDADAEGNGEDKVISETEESQERITAKLSNTVTESYGNDEISLLTKRVNDVRVKIPDNQDAENKINAFFEERNEALKDTVELYADLVETTYYAWRDAGKEGEWKPFELGREYTIKRLDEQMICIVEDSYVYAGGDRTNYTRVSYNFDTWTGSRLSLETAASHLDEIRTESVQYIGELLLEPEYAGILKRDYTNYLEDILTDATWYTDKKGMYVICNEDTIAPVKEGILEFFLPYEEVDVIDEVYIPEEKAD